MAADRPYRRFPDVAQVAQVPLGLLDQALRDRLAVREQELGLDDGVARVDVQLVGEPVKRRQVSPSGPASNIGSSRTWMVPIRKPCASSSASRAAQGGGGRGSGAAATDRTGQRGGQRIAARGGRDEFRGTRVGRRRRAPDQSRGRGQVSPTATAGWAKGLRDSSQAQSASHCCSSGCTRAGFMSCRPRPCSLA